MEVWYHGTPKWREILSAGINIDAPRPTADSGDFGWGFYLTRRLPRAKAHGKVFEVSIDTSKLAYISNPYLGKTDTSEEQLFTNLAFVREQDDYDDAFDSLVMLTTTGTKQDREEASKRIRQEFLQRGWLGIKTDYEGGEVVLFDTTPILNLKLSD